MCAEEIRDYLERNPGATVGVTSRHRTMFQVAKLTPAEPQLMFEFETEDGKVLTAEVTVESHAFFPLSDEPEFLHQPSGLIFAGTIGDDMIVAGSVPVNQPSQISFELRAA
jgi:hypothetical protein